MSPEAMSHFYNRRKKRRGAFWEGRYRATLVQNGTHSSRCLFYIALNMARAKVVRRPPGFSFLSVVSEWLDVERVDSGFSVLLHDEEP